MLDELTCVTKRWDVGKRPVGCSFIYSVPKLLNLEFIVSKLGSGRRSLVRESVVEDDETVGKSNGSSGGRTGVKVSRVI